MRARRCTIDSSCVIALDHLDLVPKLSFLFSIVLVPKAVREELLKHRAAKDRLQAVFDTYAFFSAATATNKAPSISFSRNQPAQAVRIAARLRQLCKRPSLARR